MQRISVWSDALRIHQWSKNIIIFVPLILAHAYNDLSKILAAVLAFATVCLLASGTYIVNDILDIEADRKHPTKNKRPFASRRISVASGIGVAAVIIAASLAAAFSISHLFAAVLLLYLTITLLYSFVVRSLPLIDVFAIAVLFTLRIFMGAAVIDVEQSPWLLSFSLSFFLSLALAKRHGEIMLAAGNQKKIIARRGYVFSDWPLTLTFGVNAGLTSIVIMLLYLANEAAPSGYYKDLSWLYIIPGAITVWIMRIWLLAHRKSLHSDPVIFALSDLTSLALGLLVVAAFYIAL